MPPMYPYQQFSANEQLQPMQQPAAGGGWFEQNAPQAGATAPAAGGGGQVDWNAPDDQLKQQITAYLTAHGGDPAEADYWVSKKNDLNPNGSSPEYAMQRLSQADSIVKAGGGTPGAAGGGAGPGQFGGMVTPWTQQFQAPTAEQALQSPGLQFALQRGNDAIQKSAAARGTLLTGGTLKSLQDFSQGVALQGYGDVYNRAMGEYGLARDQFYQNQDRPFGKYLSLAGLGQNAANAAGNYAGAYGNNLTDLTTGAGNAQAAGTVGAANSWGSTLGNLGNLAQNQFWQNSWQQPQGGMVQVPYPGYGVSL